MSLHEVFWLVVREPDLPITVFPCQGFQWEINRDTGGCEHQRRPGPRISKNQQLSRRHFEPNLRSVPAEINPRKHRQPVRCDNRLKPRKCLGHSVLARDRSEEHTSELPQSNLVCRLLLEKKKKQNERTFTTSDQDNHRR